MKTTLILLVLSTGLSHAVNTISWQKSEFDLSPMYTNSGGSFGADFTFQLGTFDTLTPTLSNIDQWEADWQLLSVGNWDHTTQSFGDPFTFNSDGTVVGLAGSATFTEGEQAYLWVRNNSNDQWALVTDLSGGNSTDQWLLPSMTNLSSGAYIWELETADTVIVGGVNGIQSGTPYSYDPGTAFRLQTAAIPEPGSALLIACCSLLSLSRRRTSNPS